MDEEIRGEPQPVVFEDADNAERRATIEAFYRRHPERTLKTLVCRAYAPGYKEYIAIVTRGHLRVDLQKIAKTLCYRTLRLANEDEMRSLGLVPGYVSPVDCNRVNQLRVIGDVAITKHDSYYDGGNRVRLYRRNVNFPRDFSVSQLLDISA